MEVLSLEGEAFFWVKPHDSPYSQKIRLITTGILFEDVIVLFLTNLQIKGKAEDYVLSDAKGRVLEDHKDLVCASADIITLVPKIIAFGHRKTADQKALPNVWDGSDEDLDGYVKVI